MRVEWRLAPNGRDSLVWCFGHHCDALNPLFATAIDLCA